MTRKGQTFNNYTEVFKRKAVMMYEGGYGSYNTISKELGLKSSTQLKNWVKKYRSSESLTDQRGKKSIINHPFRGRPKTKFKSVEEERDYYKAQTEYLKKRYRNLNGGDIPKCQRFQIINEMEKEYPITLLVDIAGVSRAGYYKWVKSVDIRRERMKKEQDIKDHMMGIHRVHPEYGCPRITTVLKKQGYVINHKRVYRLMGAMGIKSVIRKKRRFFGKEASVVYPNRVNREFKNRKYNEVLATDITYIPFQNRFYYLSVVQDLYNNEIVSWKFSKRNDLKLVIDTIEDLCKKRNVQGTILHSDQGFQYTSKQYNKRLKEEGIVGSHSRKGNCLDNACVESFFSHLKSEMLYRTNCKTEEELVQAIDDYINYYNHKRFQKRLNQLSPVEYRLMVAA